MRVFPQTDRSSSILEVLEKELEKTEEIKYLINFVKSSERGLTRSCR